MRNFFVYSISIALSVGTGCVFVPSTRSRAKSSISTVFVARHAEAHRNVSPPQKISEKILDSLTPKGLQQAKKVGAYLKEKNIGAVFASPTGRTRQTAHIIAEEVGLNGIFFENPAFGPMKKGRISNGKPVTWSWRKAHWHAGYDPRPVGGESLEDAANRAVKAVETIVRGYPGKSVVIVTHSYICAGLAGHATNTPSYQRYKKYGVGRGSFIEIIIEPQGIWKLP